MIQEEEEGWWNGRVGDVFGVLPATYIEAVTSVKVKFRAQGLYEFKVRNMNSSCVLCFPLCVHVCLVLHMY